MSKLYHVVDGGVVVGFYFDCPGCKSGHSLIQRRFEGQNSPAWRFNGNEDYPTFHPSVLSKLARTDGSRVEICHFFVVNGELQFLSDCTHALAGQTVAMLDIVEELRR